MCNANEKLRLVRRIEELSRELGISPVYPITVNLRVSNPNGQAVLDSSEPGHSWTRNAWNMLMAFYGDAGASGASFGAGYLTSKDTSGNVKTSTNRCVENSYIANTDRGGFVCNNAESGYGLVVGTGSTAFAINQYALATLIAHGTGSGQMSYGIMSQSSRTYATKTWTVRYSRTFTNNSGASITVNEIGLYWRGYLFTDILGTYLMARDVLSSPVTVNNGQVLTVNYDVSVDFEDID